MLVLVVSALFSGLIAVFGAVCLAVASVMLGVPGARPLRGAGRSNRASKAAR